MDNELAILALINDKHKFKKKELIDFFSGLNSIENFFMNPPDSTKIQNDRRYSKISKKITSMLELYSDTDFKAYKNEILRVEHSGINLITYYSANYPEKLRGIPNPPFLLYHKGELMDFTNCVAIVGTRNLSHYGHKRTREISGIIAENGYKIVSGLARGTDTEAHCGALDVGGKTIVILAGHIDEVYPKENLKLVSDIVKSGAVFSEISTFEKTHKARFIERNRLTSGISECLIVIESNGNGGTLQQINLAFKQGRKVFVMEPLKTDKQATEGFKKFIKLGATPFDSPDVILEFLKNKKPEPRHVTLYDFLG